jgi:transcriptional regulator with XRE-family HTH domain
MDTANSFNGAVLRRWRLEAGVKPELVCVKAGLSWPYLRALEDRRTYARHPSLALLTRLAEFFGRDITELFAEDTDTAGAR